MKQSISDFLSQIEKLSHSEINQLKNALDRLDDNKQVHELIESLQDTRHCPHCGGEDIYKHGFYSGLQRYRCLSCKKTFNALTGTSLSNLGRKELWLKYLDCMIESKTLRQISKELGINLKTAFTWRHRFAEGFKRDDNNILEGIVEVDETYFRKSKKGVKKNLNRSPHKRGGDKAPKGLSKEQVCVLVACDRSKMRLEYITGLGAVKTKSLKRNLTAHIAPDAIMVTDGLKSYRSFCKDYRISHEIVFNKQGLRRHDCFHIQNVNNYHGKLKTWIIDHFHGVATKYLNHYLHWKHELEKKEKMDAIGLLSLILDFPQFSGT